ncbi:hypothetical protein [Mycobacterium parascrofulaceum]|nr:MULTISPECIES: hypothetical protein [Mycobacterium]
MSAINAAKPRAKRTVTRSSQFIQRGKERARAVKSWAEEKRADWEIRRYLRMHPSVAPDPDIKNWEDTFYQQAHAAVEDFTEIQYAEERAVSGDTAEDRRYWRGQKQTAKANAKRSLPLLIQSFERDIKGRSVSDVVAASETVIESLAAHLKFEVPRVIHPEDALQELHAFLLCQAAAGWQGFVWVSWSV